MDICIHKVLRHQKETHRAIGTIDNNWEVGQTIRYAFIGGDTYQRAIVISQLDLVQTFVNLNFELVTDLYQSEVRISFNSGSGAWSYLGKDALGIPKNQATMNLGFMDGGTVPHEIGHMLGQEHEQQFPNWLVFNEAVVIADMKQYGWDEATTRHNILSKVNPSSVVTTEESDPFSVMMYWIDPRWIKSPADFQPRNNITWSEKDIEFLSNKFPFPKDPQPVPQEKYRKAFKTLRVSTSFRRLPKRTLQAMMLGLTKDEPYKQALIELLFSSFRGKRYILNLREDVMLAILEDLGHSYTDEGTKEDLYILFHKALDVEFIK